MTIRMVNPLQQDLEHVLAHMLMLDAIVEGTRHTLDFAVACGAKKFLLTSSGAVYGKQPSEMTHIPEDYTGGPNPLEPASAYGEGKRMAELLCAIYQREHGIESKIARCFAFVGPYLPLDAHFAIGNFIRDAMAGGPIRVNGDGTPYRSYLYAADLAIWLWKILMLAPSLRPYNVGSGEDVSIMDAARLVANLSPTSEVEIQVMNPLTNDTSISRYVPLVQRAQKELSIFEVIHFGEAVERTMNFHKGQVDGVLLKS